MAPIKMDPNTDVWYAHWCLCGKQDRCEVLARSSAEMAAIRAEGDFNDYTLYQAFSVGKLRFSHVIHFNQIFSFRSWLQIKVESLSIHLW